MRFHFEHASVVTASLNCAEGGVCLCVGDLPLEHLEEAAGVLGADKVAQLC